MTKNSEIYSAADDVFYIRKQNLIDIVKVVECVLECYVFFDPVLLDIEKERVENLLLSLRSIATGSNPYVGIALSRGARADLCSCLSQVKSEYSSLAKDYLSVSLESVLLLKSLAYGDFEIKDLADQALRGDLS